MSATTNIKKSPVSHLLLQATNTGKPVNKEMVDLDDVYSGPQLCPLISSSGQTNTSTKCTPKYTETHVLPTILKRVGTLEGYLEKCKKKLKHALSVIKERDTEIIKLKEQVRLLEDDQELKRFSQIPKNDLSEIMRLSESLENRVSAIESFLKGDPFYWYKSDLPDSDPVLNNFQYTDETLLKNLDLDNVLLQINELNFEASEVHICQPTEQGAVFQNCQSISLTFYANGLQLEGQEFREYSDLRTQIFIKDILDGFFPSELQCQYPRGVIFNVCDRRTVTYEEDGQKINLFKGKGCKLDISCDEFCSNEQPRKKRYLPLFYDSGLTREQSNIFLTDIHNGSIKQVFDMSRDKFKRRFPDNITKSTNNLCETGSGEGKTIYRSNNSNINRHDVTIKDGEVCTKKNRRTRTFKKASFISNAQVKYLNPTAERTESCVQLKIRSMNDKELYVLTMHINEPVGKLRTYLPDEVKECNIMHYKDSSSRIYLTDNNSTLKEYGIVNNSVLLLTKPKIKKVNK